MANKINIDSAVRVNTYEIISRAVEEGVAYGVNRSFKHTDTPSRDAMIEQIELAVMSALCEVLQFGNEEEE